MCVRAHVRNNSYMINNLLSVWSTIGSVILAILILLVMITVHEFGHYIAGKIFHFKINEFSIGFGPALYKHRSKKTDELFAVRLIPLGGYCAFAGEDGLEEENESDEVSSSEAQDTAESKKEEDKSGWFTNRPCWQRIIVLVAGALMNYLLALLLITIGMLSYGQTMVAVYEMAPAEAYPAEYSLQDYDILLEIEGKSLYLTTDIAQALKDRKEGDRVEMEISRAVGFEKTVDPETGATKISYDHRERMTVEVILRSDVNVKNSADFSSLWDALGIKYYEASETTTEGYALASSVFHFGFFESLGRSFIYSFKIAGSIFRVLGELLTGKLGLSAFGGPITTITMTSQVASRGFRYFLEIAGYIGVNLAVFNLLPIPALDGSKVVFTAIEWIRGKPVNRKVEAIIHAVGFILLLGFAVLVDILQFV